MMYRLLAFVFTLATTLAATTASEAPLIVERDEAPPINTPEPVLLPMIPYCEQFHLIQPGETCPSIASSVGLTTQELRGLNEFLGVNDGEGANRLMAGYWCCVKARDGVLPIIRAGELLTKLVGGLKPTRRSTRPPASTKTVVVEKPKPAEPDSPPLYTGINTDVCEEGAYCPDFLHPGK